MDIKHKLWQQYLRYKTHIPPSSSGKDGYIIIHRDKELFVPNRIIEEAINYVNKFRLGFIRDGMLWAISPDLADSIKEEEFTQIMKQYEYSS